MRASEFIIEGIKNFVVDDKNRLNKAIKFFNNALSLEPKNIEALYYLSAVNRIQNNIEEAFNYVDKIKAIEPNSVAGNLAKALILNRIGEKEKAESIFEQISKNNHSLPKDPITLYALAKVNDLLDNNEIAIEYYKQAIAKNNANVLFKYSLANIYHHTGNYEESNVILKEIINYWTNYAEIFEVIAQNYVNLDDYEGAIEYYEKYENVLIENGQKFEKKLALVNYGSSLQNVGRYDEAIKYYNIILDQYDRDLLTRSNLAKIYYHNGRKKDALDLVKSIQLDLKDKKFDKSSCSQSELEDIKKNVREIEANILLDNHEVVDAHEQVLQDAKIYDLAKLEKDKKYIESNPSLQAYFEHFQMATMASYKQFCNTLDDKLVKRSGLPVLDFMKATNSALMPPIAKEVLSVAFSVVKSIKDVRDKNQAKQVFGNASYDKRFETVLEIAAAEITLKKQAVITSLQPVKKNAVLGFFSKSKDKFSKELYDSPAKKMALEDAAHLMTVMMLKTINKSTQEAQVQEFVDAVITYDIVKATIERSIPQKILGMAGTTIAQDPNNLAQAKSASLSSKIKKSAADSTDAIEYGGEFANGGASIMKELNGPNFFEGVKHLGEVLENFN
jgi:tetratricopeptide (TPR) repeat protein